jgi:HAE1 family hydrophobic/amphiphilic exporter-1
VIGTFAAMYALGFSLDNLSLLALTLAVGFVVDDAIVMLENIVRHIEAGERPYDAAVKGAGEIGFTIFSMTLSLIAVFIPVMFMGGIVGRLFHEFAVTISVAILISGIVAITLTPMLCSRFVKAHQHDKKNWLIAGFDRGFSAVQRSYTTSLGWCMARPRLVLVGFAASLLATALLFMVAPKDFIPAGDNGLLRVTTEGPQDISFDAMVVRQQQLAAIVAKDPNLAGYMSSVGAGGPRSTVNNGTMLLKLKPANERALTPDQIIQELRRKLPRADIPTYIANPPAIQVGGRQGKAQYRYTAVGGSAGAVRGRQGGVPRPAGFPGRHHRPGPQQPVDRRRREPRQARTAGPDHGAGAERARCGVRCQPDLHHLRFGHAVLGDPAGGAPPAERSGRALAHLRHRQQRRAGATQCRGHVQAPARGAHRQPPGPAAGGDGVVQPGAGRVTQ